MTPREALNKLYDIRLGFENLEAKKVMVEALEKQIPKKPKPIEQPNIIRYSMNYICPACGKHFSGTGIADYCYHCGQALDWSEENGST